MSFIFINWQPSSEIFTIGAFGIRWYSLLWSIGLLLAYIIEQHLYKQQNIAAQKFEPLFIYCFLGVLVGARLGHCIFYQPSYYLTNWKGLIEMVLPIQQNYNGEWGYVGYEGLASHGGAIGLIVALIFYWKRTKLKLLTILDNIAIAVPITACCIRLGNLMNSEIVGIPSDVAWAFIFHTHDSLLNGELVPRHPAQLYEAIAYLLFFFVGISIYRNWRKQGKANSIATTAVGSGFYFGFCLTAIFVSRFFIEFLKKEQVDFEQGLPLDMGQMLSIPFIIVGIWCMIRAKIKRHSKICC